MSRVPSLVFYNYDSDPVVANLAEIDHVREPGH
jgi:hypothetical protein